MDPLTFWFFSLFGGIFASALGLVAYRSFKYGSLTAALFDAPIKQTIGVIQPSEFLKQSLTVYAFGQNSAKKSVGLEVIGAIRSYLTLSRLEAEKLVSLVQLAIQEEAPTERIVGEIPRSESCKHKIVLHVLGARFSGQNSWFRFHLFTKAICLFIWVGGAEAHNTSAICTACR
jgi:hypothetical protein